MDICEAIRKRTSIRHIPFLLGCKGKWSISGFDPPNIAAERYIPDGYEILGIYFT